MGLEVLTWLVGGRTFTLEVEDTEGDDVPTSVSKHSDTVPNFHFHDLNTQANGKAASPKTMSPTTCKKSSN